MNYRGHAGNQYTGSEGEQGLAPGKVVILRQAWMEHGYFIVLFFEFTKDEFYISSYKVY